MPKTESMELILKSFNEQYDRRQKKLEERRQSVLEKKKELNKPKEVEEDENIFKVPPDEPEIAPKRETATEFKVDTTAVEENKKKHTPFDIAMDIIPEFRKIDGHIYHRNRWYFYLEIIKPSNINTVLRRIIPSCYSSAINRNSLQEIYNWLLCYLKDEHHVFEKYTDYLNFKDCAYNWVTDEIIDDPKEREKLVFRYKLNADFKKLEQQKNGAYKRHLEFAFGDDKATRREYLKSHGLTYSDIRDKKIAEVLFGPPNSGKTVLLEVDRYVVGPEMCSSLSFSQLNTSDFTLSSLHGTRINLTGEMEGITEKKLECFKALVGGDSVETSYKFCDSFSMKPRTMLKFATNTFPKIKVINETDSFYDRLVIYPLLRTADRSEWKDNYVDELLGDMYHIIHYAIKGLKYWREDGNVINQTEAMVRIKEAAIMASDSFSPFAKKYIQQNPDGKLTTQEIIEKYMAYCEENGYSFLDPREWSEILTKIHDCKKTIINIKDEDGKKKALRGYRGISFIPEIFDTQIL